MKRGEQLNDMKRKLRKEKNEERQLQREEGEKEFLTHFIGRQ